MVQPRAGRPGRLSREKSPKFSEAPLIRRRHPTNYRVVRPQKYAQGARARGAGPLGPGACEHMYRQLSWKPLAQPWQRLSEATRDGTAMGIPSSSTSEAPRDGRGTCRGRCRRTETTRKLRQETHITLFSLMALCAYPYTPPPPPPLPQQLPRGDEAQTLRNERIEEVVLVVQLHGTTAHGKAVSHCAPFHFICNYTPSHNLPPPPPTDARRRARPLSTAPSRQACVCQPHA